MKRFKFTLEALARVYTAKQEEKQRALAQAQRSLREAESVLVAAAVEYERCQNDEAVLRDKGETVVQMRLFVQYAFELKQRIERQKKVITERLKEVNLARKILLDASRRVKALDQLKERRFGEWKKSRVRWERAFTDEINQLRFVRVGQS